MMGLATCGGSAGYLVAWLAVAVAAAAVAKPCSAVEHVAEPSEQGSAVVGPFGFAAAAVVVDGVTLPSAEELFVEACHSSSVVMGQPCQHCSSVVLGLAYFPQD